MGRKINRRSVYDHPTARPVNSGNGAEAVSVAGRASQTTAPASRHPEAMRNGVLSRSYEGLPYVDMTCVAIRTDGEKCRNDRHPQKDVCFGHIRGNDAT